MSAGAPLSEVCPLSPAIGERLDGKYEIVREVRRMTTGVVYEAVDKTRGRPVSLKTLLEAVSGDGQLVARFRREARAAGAIGDPHLVRVLDLGRTPKGLLYLVTERLDGAPLSAMLARTPQLAIPLAVKVIDQVLSGLSAAHKRGIVHRDVNPECIFVPSGKGLPEFVKVTDFGIATVLAVPPTRLGPSGNPVTKLVGTPAYVSPELARGIDAAIDQRTDVYSAGVVLYQMVCGSTPFQGDDIVQLLRAINDGSYPRPTSLRPELSPGLEAAIVRALDRDVRKRFPSAAAMRAEITGEIPIKTPPPLVAAPADGFSVEIDTVIDAPAMATPPPPPPPPPPSAVDLAPAPAPVATLPMQVEPLSPPAPPVQELEPPPLRLDMSARDRAHARDRGATTAAKVAARPRRQFPWAIVGAAFGVLVIALVIARMRRSDDGQPAPVAAPVASAPVMEEIPRFRLRISPAMANVTLDHLPVSARELPLDSGPPRAHLIKVAAPGHLTRSFTFTAKAGQDLVIRLGHTLPVPLPNDPAPLPAELAATMPTEPRAGAEIDRAFVLIDRCGACLALAPALAAASGPKLRELVASDAFLPCRALVDEPASRQPVAGLASLAATAESYVKAVQAGQRAEVLTKLAGRFRAEYLAERAVWQLQELARIGKDEGQHAAWHFRNMAVAARAWVRTRKSGAAVEEAHAKRVVAAAEALAEHVRSGNGVGGIRGAEDFVRSAREMLAVVNGDRKAGDLAVLDACRKLLTDFDALVLD